MITQFEESLNVLSLLLISFIFTYWFTVPNRHMYLYNKK